MSKITGSLVWHLPFKRNEIQPPQVTLVVIRGTHFEDGGSVFTAGLSICSRGDQFSKKVGLTKANGRLFSLCGPMKFQTRTVDELIDVIRKRFYDINGKHGNIRFENHLDLCALKDQLEKMKEM